MRRNALDVYDNQELPFQLVLDEVTPQRVKHVNPLVQVMFSFHDAAHRSLDSVPLDLVNVEGLSNGSAKFDLNIIVVPRHQAPGHISRLPGNVVTVPASSEGVTPAPRAGLDGITLSWEYDTDRFDAPFITAMLEAYVEILRAVVTDPTVAVADLPLVATAGGPSCSPSAKASVPVPVPVPVPTGWGPGGCPSWWNSGCDAPRMRWRSPVRTGP